METSTPRELKCEEVRISVPWGHIAGKWCGEKSVRPFLALHGWLDNYGTWDTLIPLLPQHIGVLAVDLPGHGKSSRLPAGIPYTFSTYLYTIMRIMQEYNWDKVSLLSHSVSSMTSFMFIVLYPQRVDMLMQIDVIHPKTDPPEEVISLTQKYLESFLIEEERIKKQEWDEPPVYSYDEIIDRMYVGSNRSVEKDKCHHIMKNNVAKSTRYPLKYYFCRDPRAKHHLQLFINRDLACLMAKRINVPHIVIKGSMSDYIDLNDPCISVLRENNPHFEFHVVEGSHHVHLNNAQEVSILLNLFINKWRPLPKVVEVKPQALSWVEKQKNCRKSKANL